LYGNEGNKLFVFLFVFEYADIWQCRWQCAFIVKRCCIGNETSNVLTFKK